jgi:hypothetical protein
MRSSDTTSMRSVSPRWAIDDDGDARLALWRVQHGADVERVAVEPHVESGVASTLLKRSARSWRSLAG